MRGHADLNGARPLVHHLVDADLEHLVGAQRPAAQHHAVVEVVRGAGGGGEREREREGEQQQREGLPLIPAPPKTDNSF